MKDSAPAGPVPALKREVMDSENDFRQLIFNVSHDLRGQVGKVVTFSEMLSEKLRNDLNAADRDFLLKILESGKRMKSMIESLAQYARFSALSEEENQSFDLKELCAEIAEEIESKIRRSGAKVNVGETVMVKGSRTQIKFALMSLFDNAIKFAKKGIDPEIKISGSVCGPCSEIRVSDNGIGFDEKDSQKIFEPFQTLHPKGAYEGTGIGLSIAGKIVKNHGGTIVANSRAGYGTHFTITLPNA